MKKTAAVVIFLLLLKATWVYGQHRVNDIKNENGENGWYKISVESDENGHSRYTVTQCYPSGDEYRLSDDERKETPLWVKVFCIALFENALKGQMDNMSFSVDGIYIGIVGFIFMIDYSKSDEEILESLEPELVAEYKDRDW